MCAKQVPEEGGEARFDPTAGTLDRSGRLVLDEADAVGLEVGLRLASQGGSGGVTVISMAPRGETSGLRTALAMGAARAVLVSDDALAGSDALSTAKVLAAVVGRAPFDVIVAGTESTDGSAGVMPAQLAGLLGVAALTFVRRVELDRDGDGGCTVRAERHTSGGWEEVVCSLPCLVTVTSGAVHPRYPSIKGIMAARTKPVEVLSLADLGLASSQVGWAGARQRVIAVEPAVPRGRGELIDDADGLAHLRVAALIRDLGLG